jgi:hypothetical protein
MLEEAYAQCKKVIISETKIPPGQKQRQGYDGGFL